MDNEIILLEKRCKNLLTKIEADKNPSPEIKAVMEELSKLLHATNDYSGFESEYKNNGGIECG